LLGANALGEVNGYMRCNKDCLTCIKNFAFNISYGALYSVSESQRYWEQKVEWLNDAVNITAN